MGEKKTRETGHILTPFYLCFSSTFCYIAPTVNMVHIVHRPQKQHCSAWDKPKYPEEIQSVDFSHDVFHRT